MGCVELKGHGALGEGGLAVCGLVNLSLKVGDMFSTKRTMEVSSATSFTIFACVYKEKGLVDDDCMWTSTSGRTKFSMGDEAAARQVQLMTLQQPWRTRSPRIYPDK